MNRCTDKLNQQFANFSNTDPKLLWLDENTDAADLHFSDQAHLFTVISNRIDDVAELKDRGVNTYFSDFSIEELDKKYSAIFYRVSKERFVSHHCINQSLRLLEKNGSLVLIGRKEDGIKTYFDKCRKELGAHGELKKDKNIYCAVLFFPNTVEAYLDDGDYTQLREIQKVEIASKTYSIYSKPGVYGWKKIDVGTSYLIEELSKLFQGKSLAGKSTLDLGCGSGHLSLALQAWGAGDITATDNNAAAILATSETMNKNEVQARVLASNGGNSLENRFDLIVCNPPFHKGFDTSPELSERFIQACYRLLNKGGHAYFVTNAFVNIEKTISMLKLDSHIIGNNKQFKITCIRHRDAQASKKR